MRALFFAPFLLALAGACAAPASQQAATPWLTREVGSPSQVTTRPGVHEGYRIVACSHEGAVLGVVGQGGTPVPQAYPLQNEAMQRLEAALGDAAVGVTFGRSCEQERHALRVLVRSYGEVDEAVRRTAAFVRANDLDVHCSVDLAPDSMLKDDRWRWKPSGRDVGTMADIRTAPGTYEGYVVRQCSHYGLVGIEGTGRMPRPSDQASLARLSREIEAYLQPVAVGVGFGLGCRQGEAGFTIYIRHLRDADVAIERAGAFVRANDLATTMTVQLVGEAVDL